MQSRISAQRTVIVALLIVIGVMIPMFSPVRLVSEPASFTLAIHTPIFIAMFISPLAAFAVVVGTTLGFFIGSYPSVIAARAASHVFFAVWGAWYLRRKPRILSSFWKTQAFSFVIGIIHAWAEVAVVGFFYMNGDTADTFYTANAVWLLVGLGSLVHGMVDFVVAQAAFKLLSAQKALRGVFISPQSL
jgi:niacin transporter